MPSRRCPTLPIFATLCVYPLFPIPPLFFLPAQLSIFPILLLFGSILFVYIPHFLYTIHISDNIPIAGYRLSWYPYIALQYHILVLSLLSVLSTRVSVECVNGVAPHPRRFSKLGKQKEEIGPVREAIRLRKGQSKPSPTRANR